MTKPNRETALTKALEAWRMIGAAMMLSEDNDGAFHFTKYGKRKLQRAMKITAALLDPPSGEAQGET